jgi:hypothetical protein
VKAQEVVHNRKEASTLRSPFFCLDNGVHYNLSMGLLFLLFEKSGYRWSKYYNTSCRKEFSLIHVIKDKVSDSWTNLLISPWFTLCNAVFYCV